MECKHCYATKKQHATMKSHKFEPAPKFKRGKTLEQLIAESKRQ